MLVCKTCKGKNIMIRQWVDVNSFEYRGDTEDDDVWCEDCENFTEIEEIGETIIEEILKRKRIGIDCTEEESAEIKQWLKEPKFVGEQKIVAEIQSLFPQEYGEFLDEN